MNKTEKRYMLGKTPCHVPICPTGFWSGKTIRNAPVLYFDGTFDIVPIRKLWRRKRGD